MPPGRSGSTQMQAEQVLCPPADEASPVAKAEAAWKGDLGDW